MTEPAIRHLTVRMPPELCGRIRDHAKANRRSMNSEIIHHLDRALATENENGPAATGIAPDLEHDHSR